MQLMGLCSAMINDKITPPVLSSRVQLQTHFVIGTGKTHTLNQLINYFKSSNQRHLLRVVAPTGCAALNLNGSTIHSLINKKPSNKAAVEKDLVISKTSKSILENQLKNCHYLILDEFSMCGASLLGQLHNAICAAKNCTDTSIPFGGVNVIFAGDL